MVDMTFEELFNVGVSFESAVGEGTKEERARIPKNNSRIIFNNEEIEKIVGIKKKYNFLVSGEIWCPDFQINALVLKRFVELNPNFDMSVITLGRGRKFISKLLKIEKEDFKAPTILFLDENFNLVGTFIERPKKVRDMGVEKFEEIKVDYYKGKYIKDTINDFLNILV